MPTSTTYTLPKPSVLSEYALTLIVFGFGIMFSSTPFQGVAGTEGRRAILASGFGLLVLGLITLIVHRPTLIRKSLLLPSISGLLYIFGNGYLRDQDVFDSRTATFIFIAFVCFISGRVVGTLSNHLRIDIPSRYFFLLMLFLAGNFAWYLFIDIQSLALAARIAGDDDLHPVGVAYVLACCGIMTAAVGLNLPHKTTATPLLIGALLLIVLNLLSTGSRGAMLAFSATLMFLAFVHNRSNAYGAARRPSLRPISGTLKVLLIASAPIGAAALLSSEAIIDQAYFVLARFESLVQDAAGDASTSERLAIWRDYISRFGEFWLVGLPGYSEPYPHNLLFEMWLRFGLPGFLLASITIITVVKVIARARSHSYTPMDYLFVSLFLFGFTNGLFNLSLEANRAFWLGFGYASARMMASNTTRTAVRPRPAVDRGRPNDTRHAIRI